MPALRMKRMLEDTDFANEFNTKTVKSMKISHFHVSELEQSAVLNSSDKVPQDDSHPTIQLADQNIRVMEASGLHDLHGGKSVGVFKMQQPFYIRKRLHGYSIHPSPHS